MKYLILLLMFSCLATAQQKDNNAIIIPDIYKQEVIKVFKERGYTIKRSDKRFVTAVTQNELNNTIQFTITLEGNTGYLMGVYGDDSISFHGENSDSTAGKKTNAPFIIMDSLARAFGKPVTYTTNL